MSFSSLLSSLLPSLSSLHSSLYSLRLLVVSLSPVVMAKDDENPPSKRLRQFRKLFNDFNNKDLKKSSGRRSTASPATESPVSTPTRRSVARTPRSRKKEDTKSRGAEPRESPSPSPTRTPEKKKDDDPEGTKTVAEAKELAKADDEEFENDANDNLAKCRIKSRELQWKAAPLDDKTKRVAEAVPADKNVYKSYDEDGEVGVRRKKSRATPVKKTSRRKKSTSGGSPAFNPSAEALDDVPPKELDKGLRCRTKKTGNPALMVRASPSAESCNEDFQDIDQNSKDFKQAIKLMEILKRNNLLENALFPAQNEVVRAFFEGGMRNPDNKILGLISKAMDFVLDAVFYRGEDLDCMLDNDLKLFIVDRSKSKPILLDVIISRPEFLPQSWGGRTVVLRAAAAEATVHLEPKK